MKVINRVEKPKWSKEVTCTGYLFSDEGCRSVLLIDTDNLYTRGKSHSGSDMIFFICPVCNERNHININFFGYEKPKLRRKK